MVLAECETWKRHDDVVSPGGMWYTLKSVTDCQSRCLQTPSCVAVDVSSSICVVHTDADDVATKYSSVDFTQYILDLACRSPRPTSASSTPGTVGPGNN